MFLPLYEHQNIHRGDLSLLLHEQRVDTSTSSNWLNLNPLDSQNLCWEYSQGGHQLTDFLQM